MALSKTDLVALIRPKLNVSQSIIATVLDALMQEIELQASNGEKITLRNFGTFQNVHRAERKVRNPATGAESIAPASSTLKFKAAKPK